MGEVVKLVKDKAPLPPKSESALCLLFHKYGKWMMHGKSYQRRECIKCGHVKERYI